MKKHVFLFDEGSRAAVYGIGTYIRQMIVCLSDMEDLELHLVRLNSDTEHFERVNQLGKYEEINIPSCCLRMGDKFSRYYRNCWYMIRLTMQIKEGESVYFLLNYTNHRQLIPQMRELFPSCRIFFVIHYQNWCFAFNGKVSRLKELLDKNENDLSKTERKILKSYRDEKEAYEWVDQVICLSHFTEKLLGSEYGILPTKTKVIYNGLVDAEPCFFEQKNVIKRHLGVLEKEKVVLFVGRLDPIKGVKLLIRSFIALLSRRSDCRLVLVGDGNFSDCLKECDGYWNQITFTGRLEKERLYQLYQIADIGVLPSMHEQCSYTAIEMMMFGIPLVASTTTGLKEMIRDNKSDYLFDMQDEDDKIAEKVLSELMYNLLSESSGGYQRKQNARANFEDNYSIEIMSNQYKQLFV